MIRVMVFNRLDEPVCELSEDDVFGLVREEEVNGEHSLTVTTTRVLEEGWRILTRDGRGKWREHVVYGIDSLHSSGDRPVGTYYCVWSLQHDLAGTRVSRMPGVQEPVAAAVALEAALSGTARWSAGTVTNTNVGGASMYDTDGWSAMATLVAEWGGEVDVTIGVGQSGITSREVDLYSAQGEQSAKRRFDFGADLRSVRRTVPDGPLYCRITPRGKGEETDSGGYGRKITIETVNDGKDYLENPAMTELAKLPDGRGGWEYPTLEVENPDCETPEELLAWAQGVVADETTPKVSYEVDVLQAGAEGVDAHGVSLGDAVQVVDRKFDGLRIEARAVKMTVNMLNEADTQLTLGHMRAGLADLVGGITRQVAEVAGAVQAMNGGTMSTADYLSRLLDRLNAEINATGGYWYVVPGQGTRTYDRAVSDPSVGSEATRVVEVRGGTIRIADSRTAQGDWEWRTVFTAGRISADMVTAVHVTAGYIGSAESGNYWNLDTGELQMASSTVIGGKTADEIIEAAEAYGLDKQSIQNQLDQKAETWYQAADPAGTWTTVEARAKHEGDLWYRTTDDTTWRYDGSTWVAQGIPSDVFDEIDGKAQVFLSQPVPPYSEGDLWFNSSAADIMTCVNSRASGSYVASDWAKRNKYVDDTDVSNAVSDFSSTLNQQEIFNRLTNNGQNQGIYLQNGLIYINGEYIKAKTIKTVDLESDGSIISLGKQTTIDGQVYQYQNSRVVLKNGAIYLERKRNDEWVVAGQFYSVPNVGTSYAASMQIQAKDALGLDVYNALTVAKGGLAGSSGVLGTGISADIKIPYTAYVNTYNNTMEWHRLTLRFIHGILTSITDNTITSRETYSRTNL